MSDLKATCPACGADVSDILHAEAVRRGKAGRGAVKARPPEVARAAAKARWSGYPVSTRTITRVVAMAKAGDARSFRRCAEFGRQWQTLGQGDALTLITTPFEDDLKSGGISWMDGEVQDQYMQRCAQWFERRAEEIERAANR